MTKTNAVLFHVLVLVTILTHNESHYIEGIFKYPVKALTSTHHMVP